MEMQPFGKPKSKEELETQVKKAQIILGENIYPPNLSNKDDLDISEIKTEYKTRYDAYVASIRREHRGDIDTIEIKHAKEWITALNNLDKYIKDHESKTNPLLREKQFIVFKKIRDFLEQGKRTGYIKLPTGTGKTMLFSKITEALGLRTLIVSPSIVILGQNAKEMEESTDSEFGKYYGDEKDLSGQVTHITYDSLVISVKDNKINPNVPVLILDEAHRSLGPERMATINKFGGLKIGFTATPEFSEYKKVSHLLGEQIYNMDVGEAINEGLICQTQTVRAYTDVDLSSVNIINGEYDKVQLEKVINIQGRNLAAVELFEKKFSDLKVICNCSGVAHARALAKLFNDRGISAVCVTGDTPAGDKEGQREWIFDQYRQGNIKVLTNARVLIEGFNEPSCSVTFNLHPTFSRVDAEQRVRSGRLDKNVPDKWNYVVDFIDKDLKRLPILYSEILKSDRVWDISKPESIKTDIQGVNERQVREPRPPINFDDFSMEGLRVVVNTQNTMMVTNRNLDFRKPKEIWTYETLRYAVRQSGIESSVGYRDNAPKNGWPGYGTLVSMPEFPKKSDDGSNDLDAFFGIKKWTYETLQDAVRKADIKSYFAYRKNSHKNGWPGFQILIKMPGFSKKLDGSNDWDAFFGIKKWTYETLQEAVREAGMKSSFEYQNNSSKNGWPALQTFFNMPGFPKKLDGLNDWGAIFSVEKKSIYKTVQEAVREAGIKSSKDYSNNASKNRWPSLNTLTSMPEFPKKPDGSNDWDAFLGKEKK